MNVKRKVNTQGQEPKMIRYTSKYLKNIKHSNLLIFSFQQLQSKVLFFTILSTQTVLNLLLSISPPNFAYPTKLQLDVVGVDLVFPLSQLTRSKDN